jgi:hypothetical protein
MHYCVVLQNISANGESKGVGTGCIRDPRNGVCGCENSDGKFISGGTNCK